MPSERHHRYCERLKKEEAIFMADHENLLLELGLVSKSIYNFDSEKMGRQYIMVWKFQCTDLGGRGRSSTREKRS